LNKTENNLVILMSFSLCC